MTGKSCEIKRIIDLSEPTEAHLAQTEEMKQNILDGERKINVVQNSREEKIDTDKYDAINII